MLKFNKRLRKKIHLLVLFLFIAWTIPFTQSNSSETERDLFEPTEDSWSDEYYDENGLALEVSEEGSQLT